MRKVTHYECEICKKLTLTKKAMKQHEEMCRWKKEGHAVWVEGGKVRHAEKVPATLFGPHGYTKDGTSDCSHGCGCWAGPSRSGGPVDPLGPCPQNPISREGEQVRQGVARLGD